MKTVFAYALGQLRGNRRSSAFILLAVVIASMLLTVVGAVAYQNWSQQVVGIREFYGDWQLRITEEIPYGDVKYLRQNPAVDQTMLQTELHFAYLPEQSVRPYLVYSELNEAGWQGMAMGRRLTEGRLPQAPGEVILSRQFALDQPQYQLGDTLTLPQGQRIWQGEEMSVSANYLPGEQFLAESELILTIVGWSDVQATSAYPAYHAYGYLTEEQLAADAAVTVAVSFHNLRETYAASAQIAASLKLAQDADGFYPLLYNDPLLGCYGLSSTDSRTLSESLMLGILGGLGVMLLFASIIYNAFAVFAGGQLRQLGVLKTVGATPRQIRATVLAQGLGLALPAVPVGLLLGLGVFYLLMQYGIAHFVVEDYSRYFTWPPLWLLALVVLAALVTVLVSAWRPARRLAKLTPVEAVKENPTGRKQKMPRQSNLAGRLLGLEGELAANALSAGRRANRATVLSLCLTLVVLGGALGFLGVFQANAEDEIARQPFNMELVLRLTEQPPESLMAELTAVTGIERLSIYRSTSNSVLLTAQDMIPGLELDGKFRRDFRSLVREEAGGNRHLVRLFGLEEASFATYCAESGLDSTLFTEQEGYPVVFVNQYAGDNPNLLQRYGMGEGPLLALEAGAVLAVDEWSYEGQGLATSGYQARIVAVSGQYPAIYEYAFPYQVTLVAPMPVYLQIVRQFSPQRGLETMYLELAMEIAEPQLAVAEAQLADILTQHYAETDYSLYSANDRRQEAAEAYQLMLSVFLALTLFLAFVGCSSAFSAISGSLTARRRQFAMLRSVGLIPQGLRKMLLYESLLFVLKPLLYALPVVLLALWLINRLLAPLLSFAACLAALQWGLLSGFALALIAVILLAYGLLGRKVQRQPIVEAVRDETY